MPKVTYVTPDGSEVTLDAREGDSVMEVAVKNGVKGIVAECGGACSCATCHVYVDPEFVQVVGDVSDLEDDMLDGAEADRMENSRLSCQIKMSTELDGLKVRVAPRQ